MAVSMLKTSPSYTGVLCSMGTLIPLKPVIYCESDLWLLLTIHLHEVVRVVISYHMAR